MKASKLWPVIFFQLAVAAASAGAFDAPPPVATVGGMVMALERAQANREGVLSPCVAPVVSDLGPVILSAALPPDFLAGLAGIAKGGVTVYPVTLQTDDVDGAVLFRNADGELFYAVGGGDPEWTPAWIADLYGVTSFNDFETALADALALRISRGLPTNGVFDAVFLQTAQTFRPSHLVHAYTFVREADLADFLDAETPSSFAALSLMTFPASAPSVITQLTFTAFSTDSNGVNIALAWPTNTAPSGGAIDLFHTRTLAPANWSDIFRFEIPAGSSSFSDAIPFGELPPDTGSVLFTVSTNANGGVTNIVQSQFDPAVFYTNIIPYIVTNWATRSMFFRAADLHDADGDGLTDAAENWVHGTRSDLADTDGDGLPDQDEIKIHGTNPTVADSDGDGLADGDEVGWFDVAHNQTFRFDVSGGTNLLSAAASYDDQSFTVPLPFPVRLAGVTSLNAAISVNGVVGLLNPSRPYYSDMPGNNNQNLVTWGISSAHTYIAAYWDNLYARTDTIGSKVILADVTTNDTRYCVIEYRDIRIYSGGMNDLLTLQIAIPQGISNIVSVHYTDMRGIADGRGATLGAQTGGRKCNLPVAFTNQGSAVSGDVITYCLGTATDPLKWDTDDDGMPDGWEVSFGLDALNPADAAADPNGDGLGNLENYLTGTDPSDSDFDSDGLENAVERLLGTDMYASDSDNDGISDYDELVIHGTDPLDQSDGPAVPAAGSMTDTDGDGILDLLDAAPSDPYAPVQGSSAFAIVNPAPKASLP
ncbi:MAG: hypothetical protein EOM72_12280 [Opitutae bacterium]|nr:hypothetical protein [Opitutae bacterium]